MNILKAKALSREKHKDQLDDCGKSYFDGHICQVVRILHEITNDTKIICAAYLHDTLEDTETSYEELVETFGVEIADLVNEVTHEGQADEKGFYFPRLQSREAILIKFADRLSNLSRMENWDEKRKRQYLRKSKFWKSE